MTNKDFFSIDSLNQMLFTWTIAMVVFILVIWAIAFSFNSFYLPIQTGVFYLTDIQHIEAKTKISPKVNGSGQASTTLTNEYEIIDIQGEYIN